MSILKRGTRVKYSILFIIIAALLPQSSKAIVPLEDVVLHHAFAEKRVRAYNSMKDGLHYTRLEMGGRKIVQYAYKTGEKVKEIFSSDMAMYQGPETIQDYIFSPDENKILFVTQKQKIYRHSYKAKFYVFDVLRRTVAPLSDKPYEMAAGFSPDSYAIAFVYENNLYIKNLRFDTEYQVTDDGEFNKVINGIPDWVYEEEFVHPTAKLQKAWEWSPDSKFLAYTRFDESEVKKYSFPVYKGAFPSHPENELYTGQYTFKFPKVGQKNSKIQVKVFDTETKRTKPMDIAEADEDFYVPRILWTATSDKLCVVKLNRRQDKMELLSLNPKSTVASIMHIEEEDKYVSEFAYEKLRFLPDNSFVILSEKDGYMHMYQYSISGKLIKQITKGEWDVTDFYGYDAKRKRFLFQAAKKSPMQREVYAIDAKGRITELSQKDGTNTTYFSDTFSYFLMEWSNINTPLEVTVCDENGEVLHSIEDNGILKEKLKQNAIQPKEFFTFTTSQGVELNGWIKKPTGMEAGKTYPLLMTQYSGPNRQKVLDEYGISWEQLLSENGYVVACVDGRGTGARGEAFKKCTYMQLGNLEVKDQLEAAKYLGSLPYIDAAKIGIYGWSYGGFISALALSKSEGIFKTAVAVAPITHYKFYDTVYTERYMRKYAENPKGYDENSPLMLANKLSGRLLLIHGTADDNVHMQNTMEYAEALVQANKQFDMHIYTNRDHHIHGGKTRLHLAIKIMDWLDVYLK